MALQMQSFSRNNNNHHDNCSMCWPGVSYPLPQLNLTQSQEVGTEAQRHWASSLQVCLPSPSSEPQHKLPSGNQARQGLWTLIQVQILVLLLMTCGDNCNTHPHMAVPRCWWSNIGRGGWAGSTAGDQEGIGITIFIFITKKYLGAGCAGACLQFEAGGLWVWGQPWLNSKTLSQKNQELGKWLTGRALA
jgi:hypothetical protein